MILNHFIQLAISEMVSFIGGCFLPSYVVSSVVVSRSYSSCIITVIKLTINIKSRFFTICSDENNINQIHKKQTHYKNVFFVMILFDRCLGSCIFLNKNVTGRTDTTFHKYRTDKTVHTAIFTDKLTIAL